MHVPSRSSVHRQSDQPAGPCHHVVAGSIPHPALTTRDEAGSDRRRPPPTGPGRLGGNREPGRPTIRGRLGGCSDHGGAPSSPWCDRVRRSLVRRRVVVGTSPSQSWPTSFRCRRSRGRRRSLHRDGRRTCGRICRLRRHRSRAAVVVNMHGSGFEARFEAELYEPICAELGVRAAGDVDDRRAPQRTVTRTRAGRRGHRSAGQRCPWCRISAPNRTERRGRHGQPVRGSSAQSPSPASPQLVVRLRFRRPGHHARLRIELERAGESPRRVSIRHGIPAASPRFATSALTVGPSAR